MDVDVAVLAGAVVGLFAVEPEDAGEDEILFLHRVGGFPDAAGGLASDKLGTGGGVVADLLADAVPAEGGLVAIGFRAGAFFGGGNGEGAGDAAVVDQIEALGGDADEGGEGRGEGGDGVEGGLGDRR